MEDRRRFSIIRMILICLIILFFIFLIMWIVKKVSPNMNPIYEGIFRDNMNSMQEVGESYFTNDKLPTEDGETIKITLDEMLKNNYILPFTDKNGNSCDLNNSYVSVTKFGEKYELKTNLVCGEESNYVIKILGCHDLCNDKCTKEKVCTKEKITQYEFVKELSTTKDSYSCEKGKLSGKNCIIEKLDIKPFTTKTESKTEVKSAQVIISKTKLITIVGKQKEYTNDRVTSTKTEKEYTNDRVTSTKIEKVYTDERVKETSPSTTEKKCQMKDVKETYKCNCTVYRDSDGRSVTTCSTCTKTIKKEVCENITIPGTTITKCPSGYTSEGSGSNLKCYKNVPKTTEKCPSGYTSEGSGSNLKCWYYKNVYSCPSNSNYSEGSGSSLVCYKANTTNKCDAASGWTIKGDKCYRTIKTEVKVCPTSYNLKDGKCVKVVTTSVKANVKKVTSKSKTYKWSTSTSLEGWKRTGKTKTIEGKEVCK